MRQDIISHRLLILVPIPPSPVLPLSKGERKYVRLFIKITLGTCLVIFLSFARSGGNRGIRDNSDQRNNRKRFQEPVPFRLIPPPRSAPASGLSSPVLSPRRLSSGDFFSIAPPGSRSPTMFSARELPFPLDIAAAFSNQVSASPDHSPLYSPTPKSPGTRSRNPSGPPSPLHPSAAAISRQGSGGSGYVHSLPLPPGGLVSPKNEHPPSPPANQWQKGELIGSGAFGNVYVARNMSASFMVTSSLNFFR